MKLNEYVEKLNNKRPLAFVVGAVAKGNPGKLKSNGSRLYTWMYKNIKLFIVSK